MTPDANNDRNFHELIRNFFGKPNNMLWNEPEMHLKNKQVVDITFGEKDQRQQAHRHRNRLLNHVTKVTDQKVVMFSGATSTSVILLGNYIRLK